MGTCVQGTSKRPGLVPGMSWPLPYSCLSHPRVPTKPQGNISFGKTNAQVYESAMKLSYLPGDSWWGCQLLFKSSQEICHRVSAPATPPPLPHYSLHNSLSSAEDCEKADERRQDRSWDFPSPSMAGTVFRGSRGSPRGKANCHMGSFSPVRTVTLELCSPASLLQIKFKIIKS